MKIHKFNKIFATSCDEIYALVGEKKSYTKEDAEIMIHGATSIFIKNFKINEFKLNAMQEKVGKITKDYAIGFSKTMGFEGALLAIAFGILEGTNEISVGGGIGLLVDSVSLSGIKMSNNK